MSYNILAVNPGHNASVALVCDGELVYHIEEERLTRNKWDGNPLRAIVEVISKWRVDELILGGTQYEYVLLPWTSQDPFYSLVRKYYPDVILTKMGHEHHFGHAATAFYNSGFENCVTVVIDGAGTRRKEEFSPGEFFEGWETESIWMCGYPHNINLLFRAYGHNERSGKIYTGLFDFDNAISITKAYEGVTEYLGFHPIESGKTMGLSSYGKYDDSIPDFFINGRGNNNLFIPNFPSSSIIDLNRYPHLQSGNGDTTKGNGFRSGREWHKKNPDCITDIEKNMAWRVQNDTQELVAELIQKAIDLSGQNNVCISGGYGLNCVTNYFLAKKFPYVNFYFEPNCNDAGTSVGLANYFWHYRSGDKTIRKQNSLYLGPEYDKDEILAILMDGVYEGKIDTETVTYKDVARLIADRNIVAMFQGRSESGPRALGNRSILYDPTDPKGKDYVNTVKGREWFRPFAGTVLQEHASEWFDLAGREESQFMMMAVDVLPEKTHIIPAITHVDNTCRVQTLKIEQNEHYYNLINEFYKITNVPMLFNTSFNLAGDPIVETIDNALDSLYRSKLNYLYLPELELLITKKEI